jgi:hypothetical protein
MMYYQSHHLQVLQSRFKVNGAQGHRLIGTTWWQTMFLDPKPPLPRQHSLTIERVWLRNRTLFDPQAQTQQPIRQTVWALERLTSMTDVLFPSVLHL